MALLSLCKDVSYFIRQDPAIDVQLGSKLACFRITVECLDELLGRHASQPLDGIFGVRARGHSLYEGGSNLFSRNYVLLVLLEISPRTEQGAALANSPKKEPL